MGHLPISSHIAVVSHSGGKLPVANAKALPTGEAGGNFADILASQISPQGIKGLVAEVTPGAQEVAQQADTPVIDLGAQQASDQAAQELAEALSTLPLPHLPIAQAIEQVVATEEKLKSDARLPLVEIDAEVVLETTDPAPLNAPALLAGDIKPETISNAAAKSGGDPAIIAVSDKALPSKLVLDFDTTEAKQAPLNPAQLSVAVRIDSTPAKSTVSAPVPLAVDVKVGSPGWDTAFSQRVAWAATNQHQVAELRLNPPNLGPVEIRITISNDQATAAFVSPHASVRESIEAALPKLREMLGESGLTLGNVNVSSQSFQQQQQQAGRGDENTHAKHGGDVPELEIDPSISLENVSAIGLARNGLVDIFA